MIRAPYAGGKVRRSPFCGIQRTFMAPQGLDSFPIDCGCWKCPHCAETILKPRLLQDTLRRAAAAGGLWYGNLGTMSPRRWQNLTQRLLRLRAGYRRFVIEGTTHVIADKPIPGAKQFEGITLVALIEELIDAVPYGK